MTKIALFIVYNHRYDKNIPKLDKLYGERFSHLFHLVPFYTGEKENVIPVYASSYHFQSYLAQAYQQIKQREEQFTHFFVIGDDVLLKPELNETNLFNLLGMSTSDSYIQYYTSMEEAKYPFVFPLFYKTEKIGVEVKNILPKEEEAFEKFRNYGIETRTIKFKLMLKYIRQTLGQIIKTRSASQIVKLLKALYFSLGKRELKYPLATGYSDVLILPQTMMETFSTYCGAFAATNLFVEFAIPTALILTTDHLVTEKDLHLKGITLHGKEREAFEEQYQSNLQTLTQLFPSNTFFIHPIKLSKWK